jgi:exopolyphosphatase / guanosine-5'-triphosphate,3'-diphosphate pyrophosphatase
MNPKKPASRPAPAEAGAAGETKPWCVAVIDVGATAIRLVVAEVSATGGIRQLESLHKGVDLGKDTFTRGRIEPSTIRQCVDVLRGFRTVMQEYGITDPAQVGAVATSAVREAENGENFRDRIHIATGISLRIIDEAEESRLTFMAAEGVMEKQPELALGDTLVVELGGGSTELLFMRQGHVAFSNSYRMGALRLRETLQHYRAPSERTRTFLGYHIGRTVEQMHKDCPEAQSPVIVAMSADARVAAAQLCPDWNSTSLASLDLGAFSALADKLSSLSVAKLVNKYRMTYEEAETVGPALLAYVHIARAFKTEKIVVPKTTFRDGLLRDLTVQRSWTEAFAEEVVRSAVKLGEKYHFDEKHARQVADVCMTIVTALEKEYRLESRLRFLLRVAAMLHEIGGFISNRSHHKHSMYLVLNSDLFGVSREDLALVALTARYHRRAPPNPAHAEYGALSQEDRLAVSRMAAILRVADALDRNHLQQARDLSCVLEKDQFVITVNDVEDLTVERLAVKEKGTLFQDIYGLPVVLKEGRAVIGEVASG